MTGSEVRELILSNGIRLWKVADVLGVTDNYFSRRLRKPFSESEVAKVKAAIEQVKNTEGATTSSRKI